MSSASCVGCCAAAWDREQPLASSSGRLSVCRTQPGRTLTAAQQMHTATIMPTSQTARVAMHAALRRCVRHMSTAAAASPASATPPPPLPQVSLPLASRAAPSSLDSRVTLLSGHSMPVLGLGTWRAAAGEVGQAVTHALDAGYRAIDGAAVYQNEAEVGQAIRQWIDKTGKSVTWRCTHWISSDCAVESCSGG